MTRPTEAIVKRVAALEGVDHTELVPLYECIDPDALNALVRWAEPSARPLQIEFTYHGYDVAVTGDGVVHIDEDVALGR
jgi:hypothetical protein